MLVQHNMLAANAYRQFEITNSNLKKKTEKLSSGYKINRASDDAAGLKISEKMRSQIRGLNRASDNVQDGISYVQTADGALNEAHAIVQRIRELAVQSANDVNTEEDREAIDEEVQELIDGLDQIFKTTEFNTRKIWAEEAKSPTPTGRNIDKYTITASFSGKSVTVTDANRKYLPDKAVRASEYAYNIASYDYLNYNITPVGTEGFNVSWKDETGQTRTSETIKWSDGGSSKDFSGKHTVSIGNYIKGLATDADLPAGVVYATEADKQAALDQISSTILDTNQFTFTWSVADGAKLQDVIDSFSPSYTYQKTITSVETPQINEGYTYATGEKTFEDSRISVYADIDYEKLNDYRISFDSDDDLFIETPSTGAYSAPSSIADDAGKWTVKFDVKNKKGEVVKTLVAESVKTTYFSNSDAEKYRKIWWEPYTYYDKGVLKERDWGSTKYYNSGDGDWKSVRKALGDIAGDVPAYNLGDQDLLDDGGYIAIKFAIKDGSEQVGEMLYKLQIRQADPTSADAERKSGDTVALVFDRLSSIKSIDLTTSAKNTTVNSNTSQSLNWKSYPEYKYQYAIHIQAGANSEQDIPIEYDSLTAATVGLYPYDAKTRDNASILIGQADYALEQISAQRTYFGSMQNRLEHAMSVDDNSSENTQYAESRIRDNDMASEITEYSKNSILAQAGQAMMAQANQMTGQVMELLQ